MNVSTWVWFAQHGKEKLPAEHSTATGVGEVLWLTRKLSGASLGGGGGGGGFGAGERMRHGFSPDVRLKRIHHETGGEVKKFFLNIFVFGRGKLKISVDQ